MFIHERLRNRGRSGEPTCSRRIGCQRTCPPVPTMENRRVDMLIFAAVYLTAVAIATIVLAASLFLVEEVKESSFKKYGVRSTFIRCAGICLTTTIGPV